MGYQNYPHRRIDLTKTEVADLLGIGIDALGSYTARGEGPPRIDCTWDRGQAKFAYPLDDLLDWLTERVRQKGSRPIGGSHDTPLRKLLDAAFEVGRVEWAVERAVGAHRTGNCAVRNDALRDLRSYGLADRVIARRTGIHRIHRFIGRAPIQEEGTPA